LFTIYSTNRKYLFIYSIELILFFVSLILYLLSLKGCYLSFNECSAPSYLSAYFKLGVFLVLSCAIFGVQIFFQIILRINKMHLLYYSLIFFVIFSFTQGTDFSHHGTYNSIIFILFLPLFVIIISIIYLLFYFLVKLEIKKLLILILFFIYIIGFFKMQTNCSNFYDGIGNIKLQNNRHLNLCFIPKPKICGKDLLSGVFDMNLFRKRGCEGINSGKKNFLKYLDKNFEEYNNFSYPRTEYWNPEISFRNLAKLVEKNIYAIKPDHKINNNEVFLSFTKDEGKIQISLKKNETLIKLKRKLAENYPVKYNNIYLIYIDAISRRHFIRKLKKTTKLIEKTLYTNKRKNGIYKNFNSFQFFKYHSFDGHTQGNILPIFYGNRASSKNKIEIVKYFNEKGFITASTHNSCNKEIFDWSDEIINNTSFSYFDHENVAMFCDPNFEDREDKWSIKKGKCSILRKCFYGKDSFDYNFEFILQFLEIYKSERKFFRICFGDGHEATTEVIKYIDNSLNSFLEKIFANYFDDKTSVIIFSDHGAQIPGPYDILFYEEKMFEKFLGLLIIIFPNNNNYETSNLLYNQQQMITSYDVHETLLDMININKYEINKNISNQRQTLFLKIDGKKRNCQLYEKEIQANCFCQNYFL